MMPKVVWAEVPASRFVPDHGEWDTAPTAFRGSKAYLDVVWLREKVEGMKRDVQTLHFDEVTAYAKVLALIDEAAGGGE